MNAKIRSVIVATIGTREEGRTLQLQRRGGMTLIIREDAQLRMRWKMKEEEWSWEEERIPTRIMAMLMGMGKGTDMGMGNTDIMMQSQ